MDVSENSGFYPQIIHFNRDFHYKASILGYPYFWKHPYVYVLFISPNLFPLGIQVGAPTDAGYPQSAATWYNQKDFWVKKLTNLRKKKVFYTLEDERLEPETDGLEDDCPFQLGDF